MKAKKKIAIPAAVFVLVAIARIPSCVASEDYSDDYDANERRSSTIKNFNPRAVTAEYKKHWPSASKELLMNNVDTIAYRPSNRKPFLISTLNADIVYNRQADLLRLLSFVCLMALVMVLSVFTGFYALLYWREDNRALRSRQRSTDSEKQIFQYDYDNDDDDDDDQYETTSIMSVSGSVSGSKEDSSTGGDVTVPDERASTVHLQPKTEPSTNDSWYSHERRGFR